MKIKTKNKKAKYMEKFQDILREENIPNKSIKKDHIRNSSLNKFHGSLKKEIIRNKRQLSEIINEIGFA